MRGIARGTLVVAAIAACGGDDGAAEVCVPAMLYLNQTGATYAPGTRDDAITNVSPLLDIERELPPWSGPDLPRRHRCRVSVWRRVPDVRARMLRRDADVRPDDRATVVER